MICRQFGGQRSRLGPQDGRAVDVSGRTALITGASAGIGKALAERFADRGFDLVLVARRQQRLEELAEGIRARHGRTVRVMAGDLADPATPERLFEALTSEGVEIDALVNNAGYGVLDPYTRTSWEEQAAALQVMATSVAQLCHLVLPGMKERGYGRILNVSSLAAYTPEVPGNLYGATKVFVVRMTRSLQLELVGTGVQLTALCPGFTVSEFHDVLGNRAAVSRLPKFMWMDAESVAHQGYEAVMRGQTVCVPGRINQVLSLAFAAMPEALLDAVATRLAVMRRDPDEHAARSGRIDE
jgi:short-subunit dehydrogenase